MLLSDVHGELIKQSIMTITAVMSLVCTDSSRPVTPSNPIPRSLASRQALNTINAKGSAAKPVPVIISPSKLANAQPYRVVKISR
ncbi:hypothetical protein PO78_4253 [Thauera sp. SWB20]|nr:hypothetical protein PO78_4253 [Thauera sp. SWB20]